MTLFKHGHSEQVAQNKMALEYFQKWKLYNLSRQPIQCLAPFTVKKYVFMFRGNLFYLRLCPLSVVLSCAFVGTIE